MNEAETRAELIDPALHAAGWGVVADSRTRREMIAPGRIMGGGRRASAKAADYVLVYRNTKLAAVEAKAADKSYTEGVGQAKDYAQCLQTRFAFAKSMYRPAFNDLNEYITLSQGITMGTGAQSGNVQSINYSGTDKGNANLTACRHLRGSARRAPRG